MPGKIDPGQSYTAIRQQVYQQSSGNKAGKTALRFTDAKGLYVKQGITNRWGNSAVRNAKFEDAITVVRNSLNREFGHLRVSAGQNGGKGQQIGDFIMSRLGKENFGDKLTVSDLRQIDALLGSVLSQSATIAKHQGHDLQARLTDHAESMLGNAVGGGSHTKNAQLARWKPTVTGFEALRQAVVKDLKQANPSLYNAVGDKAAEDDADRFLQNAGVRPSSGLNAANIERLREKFRKDYQSDAPNVTGLHDQMTQRMKAQHNLPGFRAAADRIADSAQRHFVFNSSQHKSLMHLSVIASDAADSMRNLAAHNGVTGDARKTYGDLAEVANEAQRLANRLPRDEDDAMQRFVNGNQAPKNFDALPEQTKTDFREMIALRRDLESIATASHDMAMSIVPRHQKTPQARPDFFQGKSLKHDTQLTKMPLSRLSGNIKVPESVYQKGLPNKGVDGSGDALAEQNLRHLTDAFNKATWHVQQALHDYRQNPDSAQHLAILIDAADTASAIGDRLRTKLDLVQVRNKGAAAPDAQSSSNKLRQHHQALNDIHRMAAIDMSRMRQANGQGAIKLGGDIPKGPNGGDLDQIRQIIDNLVAPNDKDMPVELRHLAKAVGDAIDNDSGDLATLLWEIEKAGHEANRIAIYAKADDDDITQQKAEAMVQQLGQAASQVRGLIASQQGDDSISVASSNDLDSTISDNDVDDADIILNDEQVDAFANCFNELHDLSLKHDIDIDEVLHPLNALIREGGCSEDELNDLSIATAKLLLTAGGGAGMADALKSLQTTIDELEPDNSLVDDDTTDDDEIELTQHITIGNDDEVEEPKAAGADKDSHVTLNATQLNSMQKHLSDIEDRAQEAGLTLGVHDLTHPLGNMIRDMGGDFNEVSLAAAKLRLQYQNHAELSDAIRALQRDLDEL